jgi:hypothetical protein
MATGTPFNVCGSHVAPTVSTPSREDFLVAAPAQAHEKERDSFHYNWMKGIAVELLYQEEHINAAVRHVAAHSPSLRLATSACQLMLGITR